MKSPYLYESAFTKNIQTATTPVNKGKREYQLTLVSVDWRIFNVGGGITIAGFCPCSN